MINVLIVGSGGREHAIAKAISKSKIKHALFCLGTHENPMLQKMCAKYLVVKSFDIQDDYVRQWILSNPIHIAIIGPEKPLSENIVSQLQKYRIQCIGPTQEFAKLEASKGWCRNFMEDYGMSQYLPNFRYFCNYVDVENYLRTNYANAQFVIKADGLKSGKGVLVQGVDFDTLEQGIEHCKQLAMNNESFVIEERLIGQEFSLISFSDGKNVQHTIPVRDFKRRDVGDLGPNTGGMGSISCANHLLPFLDGRDVEISQTINEQVLQNISYKLGNFAYKGFLYGSFIKTKDGIKVIEYNVRLGDPECINILHLLKDDFLDVCLRIVTGTLTKPLNFQQKDCVCIYLAPDYYASGQQKEEIQITLPSNSENFICAGVGKDYKATGSRTCAIINDLELLEDVLKSNSKLFCRKDIGMNYFQNNPNGLTYAECGVNVDENEATVAKITDSVRSTYTSKVLGGIGDFGGMIKMCPQMGDILVSSTDGVGTKTHLVTQLLGKEKGLESLGHDIVNHCVNDILVMGCVKPLFFMDYIASDKINSSEIACFVKGVADACKKVGCVLLGGETAEMRLTYKPGAVDLVGTIVGTMFEHERLHPLSTIKPGDVIFGLPSSGFHTNGYSLLNTLGKDPEFAKTFNDYLCQPHKCYLQDVLKLREEKINLKGLCHITGGGWIENPKRICPDNVSFEFYWQNWPKHSIYEYLGKQMNVNEIRKTFNCGIGMMIIIPGQDMDKCIRALPHAIQIGQVVQKDSFKK